MGDSSFVLLPSTGTCPIVLGRPTRFYGTNHLACHPVIPLGTLVCHAWRNSMQQTAFHPYSLSKRSGMRCEAVLFRSGPTASSMKRSEGNLAIFSDRNAFVMKREGGYPSFAVSREDIAPFLSQSLASIGLPFRAAEAAGSPPERDPIARSGGRQKPITEPTRCRWRGSTNSKEEASLPQNKMPASRTIGQLRNSLHAKHEKTAFESPRKLLPW